MSRLALAPAAALLAALAVAAPAGADPLPGIYAHTTGVDTVVTIPSGVCAVDWIVVGGRGGDSATELGGHGGEVQVRTDVSAGDTFTVQVGAAGPTGSGVNGVVSGGTSGTAASGGNSASTITDWGGSGGGASFVRIGSASGTPLIVAGGGGGAGGGHAGGNAGPIGDSGASFTIGPYDFTGGGGGTATSPGNGGYSDLSSSGSFGTGSLGGDAAEAAGAGGGGWYGGGSGGQLDASEGAGGGGGSNLAPADATVNGTTAEVGSGSIEGRYVDCPEDDSTPTTPTVTFTPTTTDTPAPAPPPEAPVTETLAPAPPTFASPFPAHPSPQIYGVQPDAAPTVVTAANRAPVRFTCPAATNGCQASGVVTLRGIGTLARFSDVTITAGRSRTVAVQLRPNVVKRLQREGVRKVTADLVIDNQLDAGPTVRTTARVSIVIPAARRG